MTISGVIAVAARARRQLATYITAVTPTIVVMCWKKKISP